MKGYSIFEVTPQQYQIKGWAERPEGDAMVWEISAQPAIFHAGISYRMKLVFSRRSSCVMATLIPSDGSPMLTLRELSDQCTPDHPLLLSLGGKSKFAALAFQHLNKLV